MSTNYISQINGTNGTTYDLQEGVDTRIFRATCSTAAGTAAKVATLDDATNYTLATGVKVAVTFTYGNSAATPTLNVNSGGAKTIAFPTAVATKTTGNGTTYNLWGPYETVIFVYDGTYWVNTGSALGIYNAYALANSKTDNTGTVTQVTAGTGLSGTITTSGTINHSNSVTAQSTQAVYPIKIDAQGHISAYGSAVTIPSDINVTSTAVTAATTNYITGSTTSTTTTGTLSKHASAVMYTTADSGTSGYTQLRLGNTTATSSAGGKEGQIRLYGTNATYYLDLKPGAIASSNKTITFPNASGTVALTSDIPTVPDVSGKIDTAGTGLSKSGTTLNHSNSVTAQTTQAVYPIKIDAQGHISAYGSAVTIPDVSGKIDTAGTGLSKSGTTLNHSNSVTAGTAGTSSATSGSTLAVPYVTYDAQGHITATGTHTHTVSGFLTSSSTLDATKLSGTIPSGCYTDNDTKVSTAAVSTNGTYYYPIVGSDTTAAATKYYDKAGFTYQVSSQASTLTLGNSTATSSSDGRSGQIIIKGTGTTGVILVTDNSGTSGSGNYQVAIKEKSGTLALTSDIPTVPSYGTSASAVGTTASGGSETTWSRSDHVHNITSSTITSALGYTPYDSTNPNGYTSNTGTVTGVKVNGTTISPTSGVVDIGTVATSDTKVTQQVTNSADTTSIWYDVLFSNNEHNAGGETAIARKSGRLMYNPNTSGDNVSTLSTGFTEIGRINFYNTDNTTNTGVGWGVGLKSTSQSEAFYRTADGAMRLRKWSEAKGSGGSVTTQYIANQLNAGHSAVYLTQYSSADTASNELRLYPDRLMINNKSLYSTGIDKVNNFANGYHVYSYGSSTTISSASTFTQLTSFTITNAGTYLVCIHAQFPKTATSGTRILRLSSSSSTDAIHSSAEAVGVTQNNEPIHLSFSGIYNLTANTTYRVMGWTSTASQSGCYGGYSYVRLL